MGFNAKVYEERAGLVAGLVGVGVVFEVQDGITRDFVNSECIKAWQGDKDSPAINVHIEVIHNKISYKFPKMLTYRLEDGKTIFSRNSNMSKYFKKYRKLPEVGDKVQVITNPEGFWRLVIE